MSSNSPARPDHILTLPSVGLVFDNDLTLTPTNFVDPYAVAILPLNKQSLQRAVVLPNVTAAILSGRALKATQRIVGVDKVIYICSYGCVSQRGFSGEPRFEPESLQWVEKTDALKRILQKQLKGLNVIIEETDTGGSVSIGPLLQANPHSSLEALYEEVTSRVTDMARDLGFMQYTEHTTVSYRATGLNSLDKGTALERLVRREGLNGFLFFGDSIVTDGPASLKALEMKAQGYPCATYCVGNDSELRRISDGAFDSIEEAAQFIQCNVDFLEANRS